MLSASRTSIFFLVKQQSSQNLTIQWEKLDSLIRLSVFDDESRYCCGILQVIGMIGLDVLALS